MFDVKKKRIIPDLLTDVQHRNGRINISKDLIANYVFDRMADDNISNRYLNAGKTGNLVFFDQTWALREVLSVSLEQGKTGSHGASPAGSLDYTATFLSPLVTESPFKNSPTVKYHFIYQPEGYSSKLLTRANNRSLFLPVNGLASAQISVGENTTFASNDLSGSILTLTSAGGSPQTKNYALLEYTPRARKSYTEMSLSKHADTAVYVDSNGDLMHFEFSIADAQGSPVRKRFRVDRYATLRRTEVVGGSRITYVIPNAGYNLRNRMDHVDSGAVISYDNQSSLKVWLQFEPHIPVNLGSASLSLSYTADIRTPKTYAFGWRSYDAIKLNGTFDGIDIGNYVIWNAIFGTGGAPATTTVTLSAYVAPEPDISTGSRIFDFANESFALYITNAGDVHDGKVKFAVRWSAAAGGVARWTTDASVFGNPPVNQWVHVAVTYDGSAHGNNPVIYVNGVSVAVSSTIATGGAGNFNGFAGGSPNSFIGNNYNSNAGWKGYITEPAVWNTALSATDIKTLYLTSREAVDNDVDSVAASIVSSINYAPLNVTAAIKTSTGAYSTISIEHDDVLSNNALLSTAQSGITLYFPAPANQANSEGNVSFIPDSAASTLYVMTAASLNSKTLIIGDFHGSTVTFTVDTSNANAVAGGSGTSSYTVGLSGATTVQLVRTRFYTAIADAITTSALKDVTISSNDDIDIRLRVGRPAAASITVVAPTSWNNTIFITLTDTTKTVIFTANTASASAARISATSYTFGIQGANTIQVIAGRIHSAIVLAKNNTDLDIVSVNSNSELISMTQGTAGPAGNKPIILNNARGLLFSVTFTRGVDAAILVTSGTLLSDASITVRGLSYDFYDPLYDMPVNGALLAAGTFDGHGNIGAGDPRKDYVVVRYLDSYGYLDLFDRLREAITDPTKQGHGATMVSSIVGPVGTRSIKNTVLEDSKIHLKLFQAVGNSNGNTTVTFAADSTSIESKVSGLTVSNFTGAFDKIAARTDAYDGLQVLGKRTYILRILNNEASNSGVIFTIATATASRCYLKSISGNFVFTCNANTSGNWTATIDRNALSIPKNQWYTLVISVDESNLDPSSTENYIALFDSDNHGALLASANFVSNSANPSPGSVKTSLGSNAYMFIGYGDHDGGTGIATNFLSSAAPSSADFYNNFYLAEFSILKGCLDITQAGYIAESHLVLRSKSGFRNALPKLQLLEEQLEDPDVMSQGPFKEADASSFSLIPVDVAYPHMLPMGSTGSLQVQFSGIPANDSVLSLRLPDQKDFQVVFDSSSSTSDGFTLDADADHYATGTWSPANIEPANIYAWYRPGHTTALNVNDFSGLGRHLTMTGTAAAIDASDTPNTNMTVNSALFVDNTTGTLERADSGTEFSFGDDDDDTAFSIALWVKFSALSGQYIASKWDTTGGSEKREWALKLGSDNKIILLLHDESGSTAMPTQSGNTVLSVGSWYHVVVSYSGVGGTNADDGINVYLNGSLDNGTASSTQANYTAMENTTANFVIGNRDNVDAAQDFKGNLAEVAIWSTELTPVDVAKLYLLSSEKEYSQHTSLIATSSPLKMGTTGLTQISAATKKFTELVNNSRRYSDKPLTAQVNSTNPNYADVKYLIPGSSPTVYSELATSAFTVTTAPQIAFSSLALGDLRSIDSDIVDLGHTRPRDCITAGRRLATDTSATITCAVSLLTVAIEDGDITGSLLWQFDDMSQEWAEIPKQLFNVQEQAPGDKDKNVPRRPVINFKIGDVEYIARLDTKRLKENSNRYNIGVDDVLSNDDLAISLVNSIAYNIDQYGLRLSVTREDNVVKLTSTSNFDYFGTVGISGYGTSPLQDASTIFQISGFNSSFNPLTIRRAREKINKPSILKTKPFVDDCPDSNDPFYTDGSALAPFHEGFSAATRDRVRIEIDINPVVTTTLGLTTGSMHRGFDAGSFNPMGYFNFATKKWESLSPTFEPKIETKRDASLNSRQTRNSAIYDAVSNFQSSAPIGFGGTYGFSIHREDVLAQASCIIEVSSGTQAHNAYEKQYLDLESTDGTKIRYVITDTNEASAVTTGNKLSAGADTGAATINGTQNSTQNILPTGKAKINFYEQITAGSTITIRSLLAIRVYTAAANDAAADHAADPPTFKPGSAAGTALEKAARIATDFAAAVNAAKVSDGGGHGGDITAAVVDSWNVTLVQATGGLDSNTAINTTVAESSAGIPGTFFDGFDAVAVGINRSSATKHVLLTELKSAIISSAGHAGKIIAGTFAAATAAPVSMRLTQAIKGIAGNKDIENNTITSLTFIGGRYTTFHGGVLGGDLDPNKTLDAYKRHYLELPLRGRPISNFGFPFADTYKPNTGQKLDLSKYLDGPFLLEKFEIICSSSISDEVQEGIGRVLPRTAQDLPFSNYGIHVFNPTYGENSVPDKTYRGIYDGRYRNLEAQRLYERFHPHTANNSYWAVTSHTSHADDPSPHTKQRFIEEGAYHRVGGNVYAREGQVKDYLYNLASANAVGVEGAAWWRCDTFFLLREKPCIDSVITNPIPGAIKTMGQDMTDIVSPPSGKISNPIFGGTVTRSGQLYYKDGWTWPSDIADAPYFEITDRQYDGTKVDDVYTHKIRVRVYHNSADFYNNAEAMSRVIAGENVLFTLNLAAYHWNEGPVAAYDTFVGYKDVIERATSGFYTSGTADIVGIEVEAPVPYQGYLVLNMTNATGDPPRGGATMVGSSVNATYTYESDHQTFDVSIPVFGFVETFGDGLTAPHVKRSNVYRNATIEGPATSTKFNILSQSYSITNSTRELISYAQVAYHGYASMNSFDHGGFTYAHYYFVNDPGYLFYRDTSDGVTGDGNKKTMEHPHQSIFGSFEARGSSNDLNLLENGLGRELNIKIGSPAYDNPHIDSVYSDWAARASLKDVKFSIPKTIFTTHQTKEDVLLIGEDDTALSLINADGSGQSNAWRSPVGLKQIAFKGDRSTLNTAREGKYTNFNSTFNLHDGILKIKAECKTTPNLANYFPYRLAVLDQYDNPGANDADLGPQDSLPDFVSVTVSGSFVGSYDPDGLGGTRSLRPVSGDAPSKEYFLVNSTPFYLDDFDRFDPTLEQATKTFDRPVNVGTNFEHPAPYILEPGDKITLGFQTAVPGFHSGFTSFANLGGGNIPTQLDDQGCRQTLHSQDSGIRTRAIDTGKCVEAAFAPYEGSKLILYGSYIQDDAPKHPQRKLSPSKVVYTSIGEEIYDQWETWLDSELSGSIYSELMSQDAKFRRTGLESVSVSFNARTNDIGGSPMKLFASGSVRRFIDLHQGDSTANSEDNHDLVFFDSMSIDLSKYWPESMVFRKSDVIPLDAGYSMTFTQAIMTGSGETLNQHLICVGSFLTTNSDNPTLTANEQTLLKKTDWASGLFNTTSPDADELHLEHSTYFHQKFVKGFIFEKGSDFYIGDPGSDPQDSRIPLRSTNFGFSGLDGPLGVLITSPSDGVALSSTNNSVHTSHNTTVEYQFDSKVLAENALANSELGGSLIANMVYRPRILQDPSNSSKYLLRFGKILIYSSFRQPKHVNQVNDDTYRHRAALIYGYGSRPDKGFQPLDGNGFRHWTVNNKANGTPFTSPTQWDTSSPANTTDLTLYVHTLNTRIAVEHPIGVKYGMMNYDHVRPSAKFRINHYGHFRDLLEGRRFGAMAIASVLGSTKSLIGLNRFGSTTPITVDFYDPLRRLLNAARLTASSPLFSQNLDKYQRSAVPFFDLPGPGASDYLGGRVRKEAEILDDELEITAGENDPFAAFL